MSLETWTYLPTGTTYQPDQYGDLEYSEEMNSGELVSTPTNSSITRVFYINYLYTSHFLDALCGYAEVVSGKVQRPSLPDQHPLWRNFYCLDATVELMGLDKTITQLPSKTAYSTVARVTATYKSLDFKIAADDTSKTYELYRFVSRTPTPAAEYFSLNSSGMRFVSTTASDGSKKALTINPQKLTGCTTMVYTWHMVPYLPVTGGDPFKMPNWTNTKKCLGKVNNAAFDPDGYNHPAGTVLFLGAEPRLSASRVTTESVEKNIYWDIACTFLVRDNGKITGRTGDGAALNDTYAGHQYVWDQANSWWDLITHDGSSGGNKLFEEIDLNLVFKPE